MDNRTFVCADKIIDICNELKVLLSNDSTFDSYKLGLLGKLQRLSLEIMDVREDAKLSDVAFITTEKGVHVPIKDGKAVGGPMKGMDFSKAEPKKPSKNVSKKYGSPYPIEEISARGENKSCVGFSKKGLLRHKDVRHEEQYKDMTEEQYENHAKKFLQKKCGEHIDGYRCKDGSICRFNRLTGEYAKGYPGGDIKTCFFPTPKDSEDGSKINLEYAIRYFEKQKRDESYD